MAALAFAVDAPTIDDTKPQVGETLTATATAPGTLEWLRCAADPGEQVVGSGNTYSPTDADVGYPLRVRLTADGDPQPGVSEPTDPVAAQPPPPNPPTLDSVTISGTPWVGNALTAVEATSGGPVTGRAWQWSRCTPGCQAIAGATGPSYTVKAADGGNQVKVDMSVSNDDGSSTGSSGLVTIAEPPEVTSPPEIFPDKLSIGDRATTGAEWRYNTTTPKWQWLLCNTATVGVGCAQIAGATTRSYVVGPADAGSWLAVSVTVQGRGPDAVAYSEGKFISKPEDPVPPTPPAPFTSTGTTPDTPTVIAPKLLDPFPIVRIKGRTTRVGARLSLLSVRAPRGTRIRVRCRSDYCPRSRLALNTRLHRLRVFERSLRAGVVIEVRVMHPKKIGKYTRFLIRRAAPPLRRDACLAPGSRKPTRCPGS
jgi:hypothetical protein